MVVDAVFFFGFAKRLDPETWMLVIHVRKGEAQNIDRCCSPMDQLPNGVHRKLVALATLLHRNLNKAPTYRALYAG